MNALLPARYLLLTLALLASSAAALLPRVTANPLFASFAIVVGLLIWLNLIARLTLISAAWAANDVDQVLAGELSVQTQAHGPAPETVGMSGTKGVRGGGLPTFGVRSLDRMTWGSGFILGAAAMAAVGALARSMRSMVRRGRD